jgi:hypothetical protein
VTRVSDSDAVADLLALMEQSFEQLVEHSVQDVDTCFDRILGKRAS